jgi:hypothetical protein
MENNKGHHCLIYRDTKKIYKESTGKEHKELGDMKAHPAIIVVSYLVNSALHLYSVSM